MNINDSKDKEVIQETLRVGQESEFWLVVKQGIENNIKNIEIQIEHDENDDLPAEEYKSKMQNLRHRKKIWRSMLELPQLLIDHLQTPDQSEPEFDPYER